MNERLPLISSVHEAWVGTAVPWVSAGALQQVRMYSTWTHYARGGEGKPAPSPTHPAAPSWAGRALTS